jgi:hypothetical protein
MMVLLSWRSISAAFMLVADIAATRLVLRTSSADSSTPHTPRPVHVDKVLESVVRCISCGASHVESVVRCISGDEPCHVRISASAMAGWSQSKAAAL